MLLSVNENTKCDYWVDNLFLWRHMYMRMIDVRSHLLADLGENKIDDTHIHLYDYKCYIYF